MCLFNLPKTVLVFSHKIDFVDPSYSPPVKYMLLIFNNDGLQTTTNLRKHRWVLLFHI